MLLVKNKNWIYLGQIKKVELMQNLNNIIIWYQGSNQINYRYFKKIRGNSRTNYRNQNTVILLTKQNWKFNSRFGVILNKSKLNNSKECYFIKKNYEREKEKKIITLMQKQLIMGNLSANTYFKKFLIIRGIGYKLTFSKKFISIQIGLSHPWNIRILNDLLIKSNKKGTNILFQKLNGPRLSTFLAKIKYLHSPDSYKGKGIRYKKEKIKRKEGKKKKTI